VIEEPFCKGDSFVHALDPRAKLVSAAAFSLAAALSVRLEGALAALALGLALAIAARLNARALCGRLFAVNLFILFLWLFTPFSVPGEPVFHLGFLTASREGIALSLLVTVKSNAIVLAFIALAATSDAPSLGQALMRLRVPEKLSFLFLFTYRYIHVIAMEYERLATAAKIRGFVPKTNMRSYRVFANIFAMTLVNSYDRSRRVYEAMLLRGFYGRFHSLREFQMRGRDTVFMIFMILASLGIGTAGMPKGALHAIAAYVARIG